MGICNITADDLTSSANPCENRASGVKVVYFAFQKDIAVLPRVPENKTSFEDFSILSEGGAGAEHVDIEMKPGKRFFKFETTSDLGELTYPEQGPKGCRSLLATLETYHSGFKQKILGFMTATMNQQLILLVKLNNGDVHMLGDKERGAEHGDGSTATSGKAITDQNGVNLFFTYVTPTPQIYIGDIDSLITDQSSNSGV
jgi:hypothetical protein